jgi:hypothetical protein
MRGVESAECGHAEALRGHERHRTFLGGHAEAPRWDEGRGTFVVVVERKGCGLRDFTLFLQEGREKFSMVASCSS